MASKDILKLSEVGPASCSGLLGRDKRRKNLTNRTNDARDDGANKKQVSLKNVKTPPEYPLDNERVMSQTSQKTEQRERSKEASRALERCFVKNSSNILRFFLHFTRAWLRAVYNLEKCSELEKRFDQL